MNLVFVENNRPVTDSLTVAEIFGKSHDNVLRDIKSLECSSEFSLINFEESAYSNERGRSYPKYLITQDGFSFLAMGYTGTTAAKFKETYIGEFNRMREELTKPALPQNYKEALLALVGEVEKVELLEAKIQENAPKVALYDTAMNAKNNLTMMAVAKSLKIGRNKLFSLLREKKVLMENNMPYQSYLDRGYFEVRQYTITHFTSGLENKVQTLVTPKGMAWIHTILTAQEA